MSTWMINHFWVITSTVQIAIIVLGGLILRSYAKKRTRPKTKNYENDNLLINNGSDPKHDCNDSTGSISIPNDHGTDNPLNGGNKIKQKLDCIKQEELVDNKKARYFLTIPETLVQAKKWKKGQELLLSLNEHGNIEVREVK